MANCRSCHHLPSGRFDCVGNLCHCKCHDLADVCPAIIATLTRAMAVYLRDPSEENMFELGRATAHAAVLIAEAEAT